MINTNNAKSVENLSSPQLKSLLSNKAESENNKLAAFQRLRFEETRGLGRLALGILQERNTDRNLKTEMINYLSLQDKNKYVKALSELLPKENDQAVKNQIVRILGERGGEQELRILEEITDVDTTNAKRFIAYRVGDSNHLWPKTEFVEYTGIKRNFKLIARTLGKEEKDNIIGTYINPISVHSAPDVEITCQQQVIHIHRSKVLAKNVDWKNLIERPQIPFQFYAKHYSAPMLSHYLMIHPSDKRDEFQINIVRPTGRQIYTGIGKLKRGKIDFSVFTVKGSKMPPIKVKGEYELATNKFNFTEAFSAIGTKNGEKRVPNTVD